MDNKKCALVILNYNGINLLKECLPSILESARYYGPDAEVVLLDNASSDDSISFVRENFKEVHIEEAKANNFLFSYNEVVKKLTYNYVILMNNDVIATREFIAPLLRHFDDPAVFVVGPRIYNVGETRPFKGKMAPDFKRFWFAWSYEPNIQNACFTFAALGTAVAVDKKKFIELGGFDELYKPGYFEDGDLCYRAWKRGWKVIYEPKSVIYHKWQVSMKKAYKERYLKQITARNTFFFMWKNITDFKFTFFHCLLLPLKLPWVAIHGDIDFIFGFFMAVIHLPTILKKRMREQKKPKLLNDKDITQIISTGIYSIEPNKINNNTPFKCRFNSFIYKLICIIVYVPSRIINVIELKTFNLKNVRNIIVFAGGGIGNLIALTPLLKSITKVWQSSRLTLIVPSQTMKELGTQLVPGANIFILPHDKWNHLPLAWRHLKNIFRQQRNFSISFSTFLDCSGQLCWLSKFLFKTKIRVGFATERLFAPWQNISLEFNKKEHEIDLNLNLLKCLNIEPPIKIPQMTIPQYIKEWTKDFISNLKLQERTIIGIHPGAGQWCPEKRWPTEKFIGLMRNLSAEFNDSIILVFIGPDDKDIGNEIKEKIAGPYVKIIEEPNIIKVSGLVEQCNIFISNDTGLMHIADILGIPLAVIWGPTSLTKNRPLNKLSVIIRKDLPCMPCYEIGREISCQHRLCLTQIDIEEVMQVCRDLLKKIKDLKAEKGRISKCS